MIWKTVLAVIVIILEIFEPLIMEAGKSLGVFTVKIVKSEPALNRQKQMRYLFGSKENINGRKRNNDTITASKSSGAKKP